MRETIKKEGEISKITCDFCGKVQIGATYGGIKQCKLCKKDVCSACAILVDDIAREGFWSDYPDYVCKECWEIGKDVRERIKIVRDEADEKESELLVEWYRLVERNQNKT